MVKLPWGGGLPGNGHLRPGKEDLPHGKSVYIHPVTHFAWLPSYLSRFRIAVSPVLTHSRVVSSCPNSHLCKRAAHSLALHC